MGKCIYCWQDAWFLKKRHKICQQKHDQNKKTLSNLIESTFVSHKHFDEIKKDIEKLQIEWYISQKELYEIYLENFEIAIQQFLYDWILTEDEENKIIEFKEKLQIHEKILNRHGLLDEFLKALIIKKLAYKKSIPQNIININNVWDIIMEENEYIIRSFDDIEVYENSKYIPKSIQKVRFKSKYFDDETIKTKWMKFLDNGSLILTNKNIYFRNDSNIIKTSIGNIIKMRPYEDWVKISTDKTSIIYKNLDWRFAYNVLYNL